MARTARLHGRVSGWGDALSLLEEMDSRRNLPTSLAILCFFLSAGAAVLAFFLVTETLLQASDSKQTAHLVVSMAWVLIFPTWAGVFLLILVALGAMGIIDLRAAARSALSDLSLDRTQLRALRAAVAARTWRHGRAFRQAISDLVLERSAV